MSASEAARARASLEDLRARARARMASDPSRLLEGGPALAGDFSLNGPPSASLVASARPAAVLVPIVDRPEASVLLTQRASHMRRHSGQIAFPGGKIDGPDETVVEAALREAKEEVGLDRRRVDVLGCLEPYFTGTGFRIVPVVAIVTPPFDLQLNSQEVESAFEVPLAFLMAPSNHQRIRRERDGRRFYAMPYGERYIWGATAGIIRRLYETLYQ